jgi:hypothetical protein
VEAEPRLMHRKPAKQQRSKMPFNFTDSEMILPVNIFPVKIPIPDFFIRKTGTEKSIE